MKILIITHNYAPALNARAFRWTALAEHWGKEGHDVDVVTVRTGSAPASASAPGVTLHRVGFYMQQLSVRARHSAHTDSTGTARAGVGSLVARAAIRIAKKVHDLTWKKIYWPDYALPWIPFAAIEARRIVKRKRPDLVISVSLPFSSHVAAHLAGAGGSRIPWIVDIGDPFSFMVSTPTNNDRLYAGLNARAERAIIGKATLVSVTNEPTKAEYARLFGNGDKVRVMPPMLSVASPEAGPDAEPANALVFIGTLNRSIRSPGRILAIFSELVAKDLLPGIELHFFGESGDAAASFAGLPPDVAARVKVHGLVSREEAMTAVRSARALVNIGNTTSFQLPSKLVEYAASGRPIVNLSAGKQDLSLDFLSTVPQVLTLSGEKSVPEEAGMIADFLEGLPKARSNAPTPDWLSRFSVDTIARSYIDPINQNASLHRHIPAMKPHGID